MAFLLFLGAGSSAPYKIPTMMEMTDGFERTLSGKYAKLYSNIKNALITYKARIDIETMFTVIDGIASRKSLKDFGPYVHYLHQKFEDDLPSEEEQKIAVVLKVWLENYIKKVCESPLSPKEFRKLFEDTFVPIFTTFGKKRTPYNQTSLSIDWKAFTTNYDTIFENFWSGAMVPEDFFDRKGSSDFSFFNSNKKLNDPSFVKLHGSIDWIKDKTGEIIKSPKSKIEMHRDVEGEVMIFPIQEKHLYLHPWITLFSALKDGLHNCNVWIVVGYSFNDEFILNSFKEKFTGNKLLYIIGPDSLNTVKKFSEFNRNQVIPLPISLGKSYFSDLLSQLIQSKLDLEIKINTNSNEFGIKSSLPLQGLRLQPEEDVVLLETIREDNYDKFSIANPKNKELSFALTVEYLPPFNQNLKLEISSKTADEFIISVKQGRMNLTTVKRKARKSKTHSFVKPIILPASLLL